MLLHVPMQNVLLDAEQENHITTEKIKTSTNNLLHRLINWKKDYNMLHILPKSDSRTSGRRKPSGPEKVSARGVRLWEVKNVVFVCS